MQLTMKHSTLYSYLPQPFIFLFDRSQGHFQITLNRMIVLCVKTRVTVTKESMTGRGVNIEVIRHPSLCKLLFFQHQNNIIDWQSYAFWFFLAEFQAIGGS